MGIELIPARINPQKLGSSPLDLNFVGQQGPAGFFLLEFQECLGNAARHRMGLLGCPVQDQQVENDPVGSFQLRIVQDFGIGVIWEDFLRVSLELVCQEVVIGEKWLLLSCWCCTKPG